MNIKEISKNLGQEAKSFAVRYGSAFALGGFAVMMIYSNQEDKQERAIEEVKDNFMAKDECLDGTDYDTSQGAIIDFVKIDDTDTIRIMPKAANTHKPSVLFIQETDNGWYGFPDNRTGAFLVKQQCENTPTEY